ncbi:MAG: two-component system regulatory protein YycI [Cellulosilyticaceae bacterium]
MKSVKAYDISQERMDTTKSILNDRGIVLDCDLPQSFRPVKTLWLEAIPMDSKVREELVKQVFGKNNEQVMISKKASNEPYEEDIVVYSYGEKELIFQGSAIYYRNKTTGETLAPLKKEKALALAADFVDAIDIKKSNKKVKIEYRIESSKTVVTYYEVYNKLPIFDSYIRMDITSSGVMYAEMQGVKIAEKIGTIKPLDPIDKVLFDIDEQMMHQTPLTIENVDLGYSMKNSEGMHILDEEAVPVYKIDIKGLSEPIFVNAYTK